MSREIDTLKYFQFLTTNTIRQHTTDTCYKGECQCGANITFVFDENSEYPFSADGNCERSKTTGMFEAGDGAPQGSRILLFAKFQEKRECKQYVHSGQYAFKTNGLTDN